MIKAETIGNGVSISIDGDGETMQREFLGIVTTITETLIEEENMSPEEATDAHEISAKTEKHSYSMWLREEMKRHECGRMLGQGLEPAPGAGHINNGMSGYHY